MPIMDGGENISLSIDIHQPSKPIREQVCQDTKLNLNDLVNLITRHLIRNIGEDVNENNMNI